MTAAAPKRKACRSHPTCDSKDLTVSSERWRQREIGSNMSEQDKPFVVNDRRKFRSDGELRDPSTVAPREETPVTSRPTDAFESSARVIPFGEAHGREQAAPRDESRTSEPIPINSAHMITPVPEPDENIPSATSAGDPYAGEDTLPPPPTPEEVAQVKLAYEATADRLDTVMRASNPGAEHLPPMDFTRLVQSVYMSAMMQLGAGTPQGEQARVDLMGAKQSIEMLTVIAEKGGSNLDETETRLIDSALFELRMGFLEITQLLARQAQTKQGAPGASPFGGAPGAGGPRIVT